MHRFTAESSSLDVIHRSLSCTAALSKNKSPKSIGARGTHKEPQIWPLYNDVVYPPSLPNEPLRPAVSAI